MKKIMVGRCLNGMNILFLMFILFKHHTIDSQLNLVPNPSFESYSECPTSSGQFENTLFWVNPTINGTPDLYNSCSDFGSTSVPNGLSNYQYALDGDGYAGIINYVLLHFGELSVNTREYIQTELESNLIPQKFYFVSMYINNNSYSICGINNLGIALTSNIPTLVTNETYLLNSLPQVYSKKIIADTLNWVKISGIVQAEGEERFLTIGNFFHDSITDFVEFLNIPDFPTKRAHYLIDDVSVIPLDSLPGGTIPAYAGADTTIFEGQNVYIGQDVSNLECTWYVLGSTTPINNLAGDQSTLLVSPTENTTYVVEQNLAGIISYDTVTVTVINITPTITANDTLRFCEGESVELSSDVGGALLWSNGLTGQSITVQEAGSYFVTRTINGQNLVSNTLVVEVIPKPSASLETIAPLCDTSSVVVFNQGSPAGGTYYLNGVETTSFDPHDAPTGDYELKYVVANELCKDSISSVFSVVACSVGLGSTMTSSASAIVIIPNPNSGTFSIKTNNLNILELNLLDNLGRKIETFDPKTVDFDLKLGKGGAMSLSNGVYFLEVISENSRYMEKIVVN